MAKKWEKAIPIIEEYLSLHTKPYLQDMVSDLDLSAYVITTALNKLGRSADIQYGLSPKKKVIRDRKISENILKQYADGTFPKIDYDEEWKTKCKIGLSNFLNDSEAIKAASVKRDATNREKYGNDYRTQFQNKSAQTKLDRYGFEGYNNQEKAKQTKLERYGNANYNNQEKTAKTCQERYGGIGNASTQLLEKYENTMLDKYGVKTNLISENPELNGTASIIRKFGSMEERYKYGFKKSQETKLQKYGDMNWNNYDQIKSTMIERYGTESYLSRREARLASFNHQQTIDYLNNVLIPKYGENDIEIEYKDEKRYPFFCDFYIKSIDLFIECNFYWTHGKHPFNPNSDEDCKLRDEWIAKNKESYNEAVRVWTELDVNKIQTARNNNLNYMCIYITEKGEYYEYVI